MAPTASTFVRVTSPSSRLIGPNKPALPRRLSIEELSKLGALSQIRGSLRGLHNTVTAALVADITALTFNRPVSKQTPSGGGAWGSDGRHDAVSAPVTHHARIAVLLEQRQDFAIFQAGADGGLDLGGEQVGDEDVQKLLSCLVKLDALALLREGIIAAAPSQVPFPSAFRPLLTCRSCAAPVACLPIRQVRHGFFSTAADYTAFPRRYIEALHHHDTPWPHKRQEAWRPGDMRRAVAACPPRLRAAAFATV